LELLVAMSIFLIIGGVTLGLFTQHQPMFNTQQNQAALNIQIRNSIMQLQTDVVNGGSGYITGTHLPPGVLGVTITNSLPTSACNTPSTLTYSSTCFDTLNIINTEPTIPAAHPDNGSFLANYSTTSIDCISTATSPIYVYPPAGVTAAALLADYQNAYTNLGERQLLLVNAGGTQLTSIMLTSAPTATVVRNGVTAVPLAFNVTNNAGWNTVANDPLNIAAFEPAPNGSTTNGNPMVSNSFCSLDYVIGLAPITYSVSTTTPSNPQLMRTQGGVSTVLAQQVIGFKVGAMLMDVNSTCTLDPTMATDSPLYCYDSSNDPVAGVPYGYASQWNKIRSIQVSLIGRTNPNPGASYTYRNTFDNGPYQIEGVNVVVNPRNMSMNDATY
jgi:hypothetical protein